VAQGREQDVMVRGRVRSSSEEEAVVVRFFGPIRTEAEE
jgi:hypothetical protein